MLVALGLLEVVSSPVAPSPLAWAFAVAMPACTVVRERHPTWALGGAAVVMGFAVIADLPLTASGILCVLLLSWSAGVVGRLVPWVCFAVLTAAAIAWVAFNGPENVTFTVGLIAVTVFAAHEWSAHDRADRAATARADALQADLDARGHDVLARVAAAARESAARSRGGCRLRPSRAQ